MKCPIKTGLTSRSPWWCPNCKLGHYPRPAAPPARSKAGGYNRLQTGGIPSATRLAARLQRVAARDVAQVCGTGLDLTVLICVSRM